MGNLTECMLQYGKVVREENINNFQGIKPVRVRYEDRVRVKDTKEMDEAIYNFFHLGMDKGWKELGVRVETEANNKHHNAYVGHFDVVRMYTVLEY